MPVRRLPAGFELNDGELFEVNQNEIRNGDFSNQRKVLKNKMCSAMINILCETWLISWVIIYFKSSSNVTYFTEKVWVISWLTCQMICFIVIFFSAWVAHCHPNILLRPHWNKKLFKLYHFLVKC